MLSSAYSGGSIPATIPASYRVLGEVLQKTLLRLGLPVELTGRRPPGAQPGICFTAPGQGELVVGPRKFTGSSQKRQGNTFLQHGSIPVEMDLKLLGQLFDFAGIDPNTAAAQLSGQIGWLNRFLDAPVSIEKVEETLISVFSQELQVRFLPEEPSAEEWDSARCLAREKYARWQWTRHGSKALSTDL